MTIRRNIEPHLRELAKGYPVLTVVGPRQSGKTTLCRRVFKDKAYVSLEDPDQRRFALEDPRAFLGGLKEGAIIDEFQRAPELASYIQTDVDSKKCNGKYILTGSEHLALTQTVSQSLAGRTALLTLLPPSVEELRRFKNAPKTLDESLVMGSYPAIYDRQVGFAGWLANYTRTYVERDVRQLTRVADLTQFQNFLELCAGHPGQLINLSALGAAAGISHNTAKAWISILEASFIVFRLRPWSPNLKKRVVKTPKLYFYDTGLLCYLLGIRTPEHLRSHPSRGAIFESFVVSEMCKFHYHQGQEDRLSFYRDRKGLEVDVIFESGSELSLIEIKSGATVGSDFFRNLATLGELLDIPCKSALVYGGDTAQNRSIAQVLPWFEIPKLF